MPPSLRKQVFSGTIIHSKSRQELEQVVGALVYVDNHGKIVRIATAAKEALENGLKQLGWDRDDVDVTEAKAGQFFFPGFIDSHIHAPQYPNAGIFGKTTLLDWLEKYTFPLEASMKDLAKARRVYTACVRRTLAHGTTTAAYFATIDVEATKLLADLCLALGQRAFVGRVCMDTPALCPDYYRDESAQDSVDKTRQVIEHVREVDAKFDLVSPIITPRFAPSCSAETLRGLADMQKETQLPVQTHVSENENEIQLVARLFPDATSYTDVYESSGLLTDKTILAHAVHLSDEEARTISRRGSKVSHCPCSNTSLTSGEARVRWLWDQDIDVGLGTDVSGGYSPSILEAARQAALVSRHVAMGISGLGSADERERSKLTVEEVLYLGTRGGATVVGLGERVGGFEEGMEWDAQLVGLGRVGEDGFRVVDDGDVGNVDLFGWEDWEEMMAKWLFNGDDRNTKKVWVKGRLVHERK